MLVAATFSKQAPILPLTAGRRIESVKKEPEEALHGWLICGHPSTSRLCLIGYQFLIFFLIGTFFDEAPKV